MLWFWFWWWLTLALVGWQLIRGWLKPSEALGFPTVAGLIWSYLYLILPFQFVRHSPGTVAPNILATAQLQAFLAYASLLAGWNLYSRRRKPAPRSPQSESFDMGKLWWWGVGLQIVGLVGYYSFTASGRSYETTSAYWYVIFNLCYPGMSLCVAVLTLSPQHRHMLNYLLLGTLAMLIIWPYLTGARRGPTFVAIIALTFSYLIVRPRLPNAAQVYGILAGSGFFLMCLVTARNVLYQEGGTWKQVFEEITFKNVIEDRTKTTGDNEFYNGCLLLEADLRTGLYQYGTTHLAMLVHWIPRAWWHGKPQRNQGFLPSAIGEIFATGQSNLGVGGAWGAVADTFDNYWWFFPVFWLVLGWGMAAMFNRVLRGNSLRWKLHYVGVLCAVHWFVAQCLPEALVPALYYQAAYFLALRSARFKAAPRRRHVRGEPVAPAAAST